MTDQQSLDDIATLLMKYPSVCSAAGFKSDRDGKVRIHFRCSEFASLKAIASCAAAANVTISIDHPDLSYCYEKEDVKDIMPFRIEIEDDDPPDWPNTSSQIFGVFLVWDLKENLLLDSEVADQLLRRWHAVRR